MGVIVYNWGQWVSFLCWTTPRLVLLSWCSSLSVSVNNFEVVYDIFPCESNQLLSSILRGRDKGRTPNEYSSAEVLLRYNDNNQDTYSVIHGRQSQVHGAEQIYHWILECLLTRKQHSLLVTTDRLPTRTWAYRSLFSSPSIILYFKSQFYLGFLCLFGSICKRSILHWGGHAEYKLYLSTRVSIGHYKSLFSFTVGIILVVFWFLFIRPSSVIIYILYI